MSSAAHRRRQARQALNAVYALSVLALSVIGLHETADWLAQHWRGAGLGTPPEPETLRLILNALQLGIVALFALIIGGFVHTYPEPFFIFWSLGWASWLMLYLLRVLLGDGSDFVTPGEAAAAFFNATNSYFFLAAGIELLAPRAWSRHLRNHPEPPSNRFGAPALWWFRYLKANPRGLALLLPVAVVQILAFLSPGSPQARAWHAATENGFSIIAVGLFGVGLYKRMYRISRYTAMALLGLSAAYLAVPLNKLLWGDHPFDLTLTVLAPALLLKPGLALFVIMLAFRFSVHRMQEQRNSMLQKLPDAAVLVGDGWVLVSNDRARELGIIEGKRLSESFAQPQQCERLLATLAREGEIVGESAQLREPGADEYAHVHRWVRIDGYRVRGASLTRRRDEFVLVIVDRHGLELAFSVAAYVHDVLQPVARALRGALEQRKAEAVAPQPEDLALADRVLQHTEHLRNEFREFWSKQHGGAVTCSLLECVDAAWINAVHGCGEVTAPISLVKSKIFANAVLTSISASPLTRALQNLFTNAIQSTWLRVGHAELPSIEIAAQERDGRIWIEIRDHGNGMDASVLAYLAADVDAVSDRRAQGGGSGRIGVGLISAKLTVARAGGILRATNLDGDGASVLLVLPGHLGTCPPLAEEA